jgi:muramoyltetrapeptide carboxypeptidase
MPCKPPCLRPGDTIGIIAPASAPPDPKAIDASIGVVRQLGFEPKLAPRVRDRHGFLAGLDSARASDLMGMFLEDSVRAILCVRGGYGTSRLLTPPSAAGRRRSFLDFAAIRRHPKIFIGYSDITSLHCAFLEHANLVSFHGPMLNSDFLKPDLPEFTRASFLRTLTSPAPPGSICRGYTGATVEVLRAGCGRGRLIGGNLSLLCAALGTPYEPSFRNRILLLEDLDEVPYRFDRMLTQLLNAGLLQQLSGIAIGINANCTDPKAAESTEYRQTLEDVFRERLLPLKIPVVMGLPFGHVAHNATLPIGGMATLDGRRGDLVIEEAAVRAR